MRNHPFSRPLVVALAAIVPAAIGLLPSPQAFAAAESVAPLVAPNSFGLPDFGDLVERVGPAVVNISVVQERAAPEAGALAEDPFYDFLRRFGVGGGGGARGGGGGGGGGARYAAARP